MRLSFVRYEVWLPVRYNDGRPVERCLRVAFPAIFEGRHQPCGAAPGRLDLDHFGAKVTQQCRRDWPGDHRAKLDHPDTREDTAAILPPRHRRQARPAVADDGTGILNSRAAFKPTILAVSSCVKSLDQDLIALSLFGHDPSMCG